MTIDMKKYRELKDRADAARRRADRAEGALGQLMARLKSEFGLDTTKEGEAELQRLESAAQEAESRFSRAMAEFEERWASRLKE